jgi:tRNA threonylcarbamoyladenosine biosynthesis protein TsaE
VRALVSEAELAALGQALGRELAPGSVIWLEGELGAGKTTMVKALARGLGVSAEATSPTYGLVHRYPGARGPVYHVDCFRLKRPEEARDLDWDGLAQSDALLVEWPERAGPWILPATRRIRLEYANDPDQRWLEVTP